MRAHFVLWTFLSLLPLATQARAGDSPDAEIERIRAEAAATVHRISDTANARIADIQAKMQLARTDMAPAPSSPPEAVNTSFPAPDCKPADRSLLEPVRKNGKIYRSLDVRSDAYEEQDRKHQACVEAYVQKALAEIKQIETALDAEIKRTVADTNAGVQAVAGNAPAASSAPGVEGVIVESQRLRRNQDTPKGEGDPDAIVCRAPQQLPDSRIPGPEVCKSNREWAALYKAGMDVSSDGRSIVPGEKQRTTNKASLSCVTSTSGNGPYQEHITNEICY